MRNHVCDRLRLAKTDRDINQRRCDAYKRAVQDGLPLRFPRDPQPENECCGERCGGCAVCKALLSNHQTQRYDYDEYRQLSEKAAKKHPTRRMFFIITPSRPVPGIRPHGPWPFAAVYRFPDRPIGVLSAARAQRSFVKLSRFTNCELALSATMRRVPKRTDHGRSFNSAAKLSSWPSGSER
jgi:hypothetical protein